MRDRDAVPPDSRIPAPVRGFWVVASAQARILGRAYFAAQAVLGAAWWIGVAVWSEVGRVTLGALDPRWVAVLDIPLFVVASGAAALGFTWPRRVAVVWTVLVAAAMVGYATATGLAGWGALLMIAAAVGSVLAAMLVAHGRVPAERLLRGPLAFQVAPARGPDQQFVRTLLQLTGFWVLFLAIIPAVLVFVEIRWGIRVAWVPAVRSAGAVMLVLASGLGLWAARTMARLGDGTPLPSASPNRLVIAGPYRWVRNPMAAAGIAQAIGVGLLMSSWTTVVYAVCGALYWHALVRPLEEADLEVRFGEAFRRYRECVGLWVPWRGALRQRCATRR
ncbi:isoprenylcysteine carboxylmethyltransferase family protein [Leucobacter tardus]|uniref:Isoprenylcysteine carboxylmethyltransferase family protein n=1 Tax=Leucobacter tardus TaxID=501483 RepID=A0A939QFT3_9MICO|nr:isoprenylcysteine carboxylmethyltransferase family protein [Leucobacter tardus]MBO2989363.1 isoprenylcysteine carboxylmethyltransferase family protein [Leucobacter tardus]